MRKVYLLSIPLAGLLASTAFAGDGDGEKLTIEDSICTAMRQNPQILAAGEKFKAQEYNAKGAWADLLPKIKFDGYYTYTGPITAPDIFAVDQTKITPPIDASMLEFLKNFGKLAPALSMDFYSANQAQAAFKIEQPLTSFYPLWNVYGMQKDGAVMANMGVNITRQEVRQQVISAFLNALKATNLTAIAREAVDLVKQNVEQAKQFVAAGVAQISDQLMAEVRLAEMENNVVRAVNGTDLAKASLNMLMGVPINTKYDLVPLGEDIPKLTAKLDDLLDLAMTSRSEIKALDKQVDINDKLVNIAWSAFIPQSGVFASYTYQTGNFMMPDWMWAVGVGGSFNIWEWGKRYDQIKSAKHSLKEAKDKRDYARDGIALQVKQAFLDLQAAEQMIATNKISIDQARESHRVMKAKYEAQMATMVDLLTTTTMVSRSQADYITSVYDYALALTNLARAVESDVSKISTTMPLAQDCRN